MNKLLTAYRAAPSPANHKKLQAYLNKHLMVSCLLTPEDVKFLRDNGFDV